MTGFDNKVVHLFHETNELVNLHPKVDPLGDGSWRLYQEVTVESDGYYHHEFIVGFSTHWLRIAANSDCVATTNSHYT